MGLKTLQALVVQAQPSAVQVGSPQTHYCPGIHKGLLPQQQILWYAAELLTYVSYCLATLAVWALLLTTQEPVADVVL